MLSNTPRLNFCCLKIIHILYSRYHPEIIGHILKSKENNKCVRIHEIIWLIIVKMKKVDHICIDKNNSPRSEHRVNIKSVSVWWYYVLSNT